MSIDNQNPANIEKISTPPESPVYAAELTRSIATTAKQETTVDPNKSHKKRNVLIAVGSAVTALAVAGGVAFGLNSNNTPEQTQGTTQTDTPSGGATNPETQPNKVEQVPSIQLSAEKYPTANELIPAAYAEESNWLNAGNDTKSYQGWLDSGASDAYVAKIATTLDSTYEGNLLIDNWSTDPNAGDLAAETNVHLQNHLGTLLLNYATTPGSDPADKIAYARKVVVDSWTVVSESKDMIVADIIIHGADNRLAADGSTNNRAGDLTIDHQVVTSTPEEEIRTWTNVNGNWKLSNVKIVH
jgi:hypothetical protein